MSPRVLILRAPGTNCDQETAFAFQTAGGKPDVVHLNRLLENPRLAADYQILAIPGGFSYGDDISAGRIFGNQIRHHLRDCLAQFKAAGKLIIGICNGLQILVKSGVLLPDRADEPIATLTLNESGKFEDRWIYLRVVSDKCVFLRGIEQMYLPIAHAEGKFVARDAQTLASLDSADQLVLRYAAAPEVRGQESEVRVRSTEFVTPHSAHRAPHSVCSYPANPNGAQLHVAGLCDEPGRVFGLMP